MRLVITLTRPDCVSAPSSTRPADRQLYHLDIIATFADRSQRFKPREATLDWEAMQANLDRLRRPKPSDTLQQEIGDQLRAFLGAGWNQHEQAIRKAVADGPVDITVVSNADEVYRLPWELLTLADQGARVEADERVVIGYALPAETYADGPVSSATARPTRALVAWSVAGGGVPLLEHRKAWPGPSTRWTRSTMSRSASSTPRCRRSSRARS